MSEPLQGRSIDPADEAQLLSTIDRWVEREVKPIAKEFDHADRYPTETVEQMKDDDGESGRGFADHWAGSSAGERESRVSRRPSAARRPGRGTRAGWSGRRESSPASGW